MARSPPQFLKRFIQPGVAWAHLDIAGVSWIKKALPTSPKGASGFGVRLLDRMISTHYETPGAAAGEKAGQEVRQEVMIRVRFVGIDAAQPWGIPLGEADAWIAGYRLAAVCAVPQAERLKQTARALGVSGAVGDCALAAAAGSPARLRLRRSRRIGRCRRTPPRNRRAARPPHRRSGGAAGNFPRLRRYRLRPGGSARIGHRTGAARHAPRVAALQARRGGRGLPDRSGDPHPRPRPRRQRLAPARTCGRSNDLGAATGQRPRQRTPPPQGWKARRAASPASASRLRRSPEPTLQKRGSTSSSRSARQARCRHAW